MAQNRLNLNFALEYRDERVAFVNEYVEQPQFKTYPLTSAELETIGNYILWGKSRETGLNPRQDGSLIMPSKNGDWAQDDKCESLDALMESPAFSENAIAPVSRAQTKVKKEVFSREAALNECPETMVPIFRDLFRQIDTLEYKIALWELAHNKRKKEVRPQLTRKFSEEEVKLFKEQISHWNQYMYLKQRHNLVELRRQ